MEELTSTKPYQMRPPPRPATLTLREDSHSISKPKPKIRIVHIFAPEIIKTDAANFRELVQRLTGKPAAKRAGRRKEAVCRQVMMKKEPVEERMWRVEESLDGNNYVSGLNLGDVDGFFNGLSDFNPMLPLSSSSHMDYLS